MKTKFRYVALSVAALLVLAGCAADEEDAAEETPASEDSNATDAEDEGDDADGDDDAASGWEPTETVEMVVGAGPGGGSDVMSRTFVDAVKEIHPDVQWEVNNYDAYEAYTEVLQREGDPHNLLTGTYGSSHLSPISQDLEYIWSDFTPLALFGIDPGFVVVRDDAPYETFEELVAATEEGPVYVGQVTTGGVNTMHTQIIEEEMDIELQPVVFDGGGEQLTALLAGDIDFALMEPAEFIEQVDAGDLRLLLAMAEERHPDERLADIPSARDVGMESPIPNQFRSFIGPPNIDEEAQQFWADTVEKWMETESFETYADDNMISPRFLSGDDLVKFYEEHEEIARQILEG